MEPQPAPARPAVPVTSEISDSELLAHIREGQHEAFRQLFERHYGELRAYVARRVGAADVVDEIVQDVFVTLWVRRHTLADVCSARAYLYGAIHHRLLNEHRHRRSQTRWAAAFSRERTPVGMGTPPAAADAALHGAELTRLVQRTVAALPERCRTVYTLRIEQGLSHADIAHALGISIKTVESQITKAMTALRRAIAAAS